MSIAVFLGVQLCVLIPLSLCFPVIPESSKASGPGPIDGVDKFSNVDIQNWIVQNSNEELRAESLSKSSPLLLSAKARSRPISSYSDAAKSSDTNFKTHSIRSSDTHIKIADFTNEDTATNHKSSQDVHNTLPQLTKTKTRENPPVVLQFQHDRSRHKEYPDLQTAKSVEYAIPANHAQSLQLAVDLGNRGEGEKRVNVGQLVITLASSLAALFSVGVVIGIFGCCCKKQQQQSDENENKNDKAAENEEADINKKPSQVFNPSDIPSGEKDLDDHISIKDKIKALDSKLIITPSPDHVAKRKSQNDLNLTENKAYYTNNVNQPQILVSDEDVVMRDKSKSKSAGDNISKSDTQDDISDKIFDNISTHSSISQPNNPDVVIADTDEENEFAELQRGTVILKSFQRAKPPRNRSPATRTSKGKIRKPRPNLDRSTDKDKSKSREASHDREQASTTSSLSLSPSQGTSSKTNSLDKPEKAIKKTSLEKHENNAGRANISDSPMTKSSDFSDFDSIMSQSVTSISSDIGNGRKHDSPVSARYKKSKDSPKPDRVARTDSPVRALKSSEREVIDMEQRGESPSRYKKNKDSPKSKQRHRKRDRDREFESRNGKSEGTSDSTAENVAEANSAPNRLSGIPAGMNNNIFYLIDPTVKNKCKSVGDMVGDKRKSGDYSKRKSGDYSSRKSGDFGRDEAKASKHKVRTPDSTDGQADGDSSSPAKRERTYSVPSRNSKEVQDTPL